MVLWGRRTSGPCQKIFQCMSQSFNCKIWELGAFWSGLFWFFNRKNYISSNMKSFALLTFLGSFSFNFLLRKYKPHNILDQVDPDCTFFPTLSPPNLWDGLLSQTTAPLPPKQSRTGVACTLPLPNFLNSFSAGKLLMDLSCLPGPFPGLLPGPN